MNRQQILDLLDSQLDYNQAKSLFYLEDDKTTLKLSQKTKEFLAQHVLEIAPFYNSLVESKQLVDFAITIASKVIQTFIKANQFLHFSKDDYLYLASIYKLLIQKIVKSGQQIETQLELLMNKHYQDLKSFLIKTNHHHIFANYQNNKKIPFVACSEYSSLLQWKILHLTPSLLITPILDIGCGTKANFILDCHQKKLEAYGFDRSVVKASPFVIQDDWLTYDYGVKKWGTVISHMAFSNHFAHHHLNMNGNFRNYAYVYRKILESLQKGGTFVYSPDLPFMEVLLDLNTYQIDKFQITDTIWTTHIKKR